MAGGVEHPRVGLADGSGVMFDRIAGRYDLLNRINSMGLDQTWRRRTVQRLGLRPTDRVLDLATGTGDLLVAAHRAAPGVGAVGLDPSEQMLELAREKFDRAGMERAELVAGDARALPFEDAGFDAVTMAFGIRNVPGRETALREIHRVLRPGGRLAILELSEPRVSFMSALARIHIRNVVPLLGRILSGADAYRYLRRSIEAFPQPEQFVAELKGAGFADVRFESFTFGACVLFLGTKEEVARESR